MDTQNYGINGSQVNELGQHLPPMRVYGKYEPWGHMTQSVTRELSSPRVCDLVIDFHAKHGRMPSKYWSAIPLPGLKASSFHPPGLPSCFLDIGHDEGSERVE